MKPDVDVGVLRARLHYCPETGVFTWLQRPSHRVKVGQVAGNAVNGYRQIAIDGVKYLSHRLAWLYVHGAWPAHVIDHINGDPSDNRIANLRDVPRRANQENQRCAQAGTTSGMLGVGRKGNRWRARIFARGKDHSLGVYSSKEEAHAAYLEAKRRLHDGCTI